MFKKLLFLLVLLTIQSCEKQLATEPEGPQWELLGQEGLIVNQLFLAGDYLYSCAGRDGLFRLDVTKNKTNWEYLGFADSTLSDKYNVGATSIFADQNNDYLLVGLNSTHSSIGIYCSHDMGLSWVPSDSGMRSDQQMRSDDVCTIAGNSSVILAALDGRLYQSSNKGQLWKKVGYFSNESCSIKEIEFSPIKQNVVWMCVNHSFRFSGSLLKSEDFGNNWEDVRINFDDIQWDICLFNSSIAFDPKDENTIFVNSNNNFIKTTDNGILWELIHYKDLYGCKIERAFDFIEINPENSDEFYIFGDKIYYTVNNFEKLDCFALPENVRYISCYFIDWHHRTIYIASERESKALYKIEF